MNASFRRLFLCCLPLVFLTVTIASGGCDQDPGMSPDGTTTTKVDGDRVAATQSPVGVVDISRVALELGLSTQLEQLLTSRGQQLQEQLNSVRIGMQSAIDKKVKEFGEEPSDEQKQELQQFQMQNMQKLRNVQAQAQQQAAQLQAALVRQIRSMIQAPIDKVAEQQGMRIVLVKQDSIAYAADSIDITDEVISLARADGVTQLSPEQIESTEPPKVGPPTSPPAPKQSDVKQPEPARAEPPAETPGN